MEDKEKETFFQIRGKTIVLVLFFHVIGILFLHYNFPSSSKNKKRPFIVNTKIYQSSLSKKKDFPINAREKRIVKKTLPRKRRVTPPPKKTKPEMQRLLKDLQRSLNNLEEKQAKSKVSDFTLPSSIQKVHVNAEILQSSLKEKKWEYQDLLINDLKNHLHLPEYGEVKAKLLIDGQGNILEVQIFSSQSKKNENYLKNTLLRLAFPWFNQFFTEKEKHEFIITFKNEN